MVDYTEKLQIDLVEQFKEKPNIQAITDVIAHQLQDVFSFYEQLRLERSVSTAVGKQLDGIGDIVGMTRNDAGLSTLDDDDAYRAMLTYKMMKNTTNASYPDIMSAIRLFWDKPIYYSEESGKPATMILTADDVSSEEEIMRLLSVPIVRPAGVELIMRLPTIENTQNLYTGFAISKTNTITYGCETPASLT